MSKIIEETGGRKISKKAAQEYLSMIRETIETYIDVSGLKLTNKTKAVFTTSRYWDVEDGDGEYIGQIRLSHHAKWDSFPYYKDGVYYSFNGDGFSLIHDQNGFECIP